MATLNRLARVLRQWEEIAHKSTGSIRNAASLQARIHNVRSAAEEARRLALLYRLEEKKREWREYGDISFHLIASWPADLAFTVLYAFREIKSQLNYDPIPFIFKATEEIYYLRPENLELHIQTNEEVERLIHDPVERARKGAKLIARELSSAPLRYASGIYEAMDPLMKRFVAEEMRAFNPRGADLLSKGSRAWLLTRAGLARSLLRLLFGKDNV